MLSLDEKTAEKQEKAVNGEDKGDSGVETQNSEGNADDESDPLGPNCYYDKSKSFFDNISCDDTRSVLSRSHSATCSTPWKTLYYFRFLLSLAEKPTRRAEDQVSHG